MGSPDFRLNINNPITTHSSEEDVLMPRKDIEVNEFKDLINKIKIEKNTYVKRKKLDYAKFDIHSTEYNIDKYLSNQKHKTTQYTPTNFMKRMEEDIKFRQTKVHQREQMISKQKLKKSEGERLNGFNRLIVDANRRLEVSQNIQELDVHLTSQNYGIEKMPIDKWGKIYENRFLTYKNKLEEKLEREIIKKEKEAKFQEDEVVEHINHRIKRASKDEINTIVNRLWTQSQRKNSNHVSTAATNKDEQLMTPNQGIKRNAKYDLKSSIKKKNVSAQSRRMWDIKTIKHSPCRKKRTVSNTKKKILSKSHGIKPDDLFEFDDCKDSDIKTNFFRSYFSNKKQAGHSNTFKFDSYQSYSITPSVILDAHINKNKINRKSYISPMNANRIVESVLSLKYKTIE